MGICKRCIIPDSFPNVTFDNGVCSFCSNYDRFPKITKDTLGKDRLLEILTSEKTSDYDCIVPLSGGKDSTYALFHIVRYLKLKPLAVHFDSGFVVDIAKRNIEKTCKILSVDLVIGRASKFRRKLIEEALYTSKRLGKIIGICGNCENNLRTLAISEAIKRKIPFIVWGSTDFEDSATTFLTPESRTFRQSWGSISNMFGIRRVMTPICTLLRLRVSFADKCKASFHMLKYMYYCVRDNIETKAPEGWKKFYPFLEVSFEGKNVKAIYFFDYIKYIPYEQIEVLKKEIGWEAPLDREARMDCKLHCFNNYQHLKDTGISLIGFNLSVLVRSGLLGRAEAIEREEIVKKDLEEECQKVGKELGVDIES